MSAFEVVIGLEVHAQLSTESKLFASAPVGYGARPNDQTVELCLGLPGSLPVPNRKAIEYAVRLGLALDCRIAERSEFARKNYFYPDLPKNYQISQFDRPICEGGAVPIEIDGEFRRVALERIHLEEDAGKSIHFEAEGRTRVDLNRSGTPLVEIVSRPEIRTSAEAGAYLQTLRELVRWLGICDGNMEEGNLRCDANISLRPRGATELGTKVEVKNLNSIRGVVDSLEHEIQRQGNLLESGQEVAQETRGWDPDRGVTVFQRGKEEAQDYRYFPDPDLPPLDVPTTWREEIAASLPELPWIRRQRLQEQFELSHSESVVLTDSRKLADWFEATVEAGAPARAASNWIQTELLRALRAHDDDLGALRVTPASTAGLLERVADASISGKIAKEVWAAMLESGESADAVIERKGLRQISDASQLDGVARDLVEQHPDQVAQYLAGKETVLGYFVGQMMKATRGQANPQLANEALRRALEARR